jgi:cytochrome c biogenesis protein ResB
MTGNEIVDASRRVSKFEYAGLTNGRQNATFPTAGLANDRQGAYFTIARRIANEVEVQSTKLEHRLVVNEPYPYHTISIYDSLLFVQKGRSNIMKTAALSVSN